MTSRCAICDAAALGPKLRKNGIDVLQCGICGVACWRPPAGFRVRATYDAAYFGAGERRPEIPAAAPSPGYDDYAALESTLRLDFRRRIARLGPPPAGARLLDVGAAFGFCVAEAGLAGWNATGLELALAAAQRANGRVPGRIVAGDAIALPFAAGRFEAVTLFDVLEHLPDPPRALAEISRVMRPGGRVLLTTGDVESAFARLCGARWHLYTIPEHLFFFSREGIRRLLAAHGFRIESMRAHGAHYPFGYLVERVRKSWFGRGSGAPARWPGAALPVPVNLFDIVTVSAVRSAS